MGWVGDLPWGGGVARYICIDYMQSLRGDYAKMAEAANGKAVRGEVPSASTAPRGLSTHPAGESERNQP